MVRNEGKRVQLTSGCHWVATNGYCLASAVDTYTCIYKGSRAESWWMVSTKELEEYVSIGHTLLQAVAGCVPTFIF